MNDTNFTINNPPENIDGHWAAIKSAFVCELNLVSALQNEFDQCAASTATWNSLPVKDITGRFFIHHDEQLRSLKVHFTMILNRITSSEVQTFVDDSATHRNMRTSPCRTLPCTRLQNCCFHSFINAANLRFFAMRRKGWSLTFRRRALGQGYLRTSCCRKDIISHDPGTHQENLERLIDKEQANFRSRSSGSKSFWKNMWSDLTPALHLVWGSCQ